MIFFSFGELRLRKKKKIKVTTDNRRYNYKKNHFQGSINHPNLTVCFRFTLIKAVYSFFFSAFLFNIENRIKSWHFIADGLYQRKKK